MLGPAGYSSFIKPLEHAVCFLLSLLSARPYSDMCYIQVDELIMRLEVDELVKTLTLISDELPF